MYKKHPYFRNQWRN